MRPSKESVTCKVTEQEKKRTGLVTISVALKNIRLELARGVLQQAGVKSGGASTTSGLQWPLRFVCRRVAGVLAAGLVACSPDCRPSWAKNWARALREGSGNVRERSRPLPECFPRMASAWHRKSLAFCRLG